MKTNFDIVAENPATLARFIHELDVEEAMSDCICKFCGHYELLESPVCDISCIDGFKMWLEKEVK